MGRLRGNKRLLLFICIVVFVMVLTPFVVMATQTTDWDIVSDFTSGETYYIGSADELGKFRDLVNSGKTGAGATFKLTADIDLSSVCSESSGTSWVSIGTKANPFAGILDGNNKEIKNLYFTSNKGNQGGLFLYLANAEIKDLTISGTVSNTRPSSTANHGAWAYSAENTTFTNCTNKINMTSTRGNVAAFFRTGKNITMTNCINQGDISAGAGIASGLVDQVAKGDKSEFTQCINEGTITTKTAPCYGLFNSITDKEVTVKECENKGNLISESGGITGIGNAKYATFIDCINHVAIKTAGSATGIGTGATLDGCINYGNLTAGTSAAGIGEATTIMTNCVNRGNIYTTGSSASGIAINAVKVTDCVNYGSVTTEITDNYATSAGIKGIQYTSEPNSVENCINYGTITGGYQASGIAASATGNLTIKNCYNFGEIKQPSATGGTFYEGSIGGLLGRMELNTADAVVTIENSFSVGDINTGNLPRVGGLIGSVATNNVAGTLNLINCYNAGSVSGKESVGGLIGNIEKIDNTNSQPPTVVMNNCYSAAPAISGTSKVGLGIGSVVNISSTENSITTSNIFVRALDTVKRTIGSDSAGLDINAIIPRTDTQMKDSSFVTLLGSDFSFFASLPSDVQSNETYKSYYEGYLYPVLLSGCGQTPTVDTHNIQFMGAQYAAVKANDIETYATTVEPNQAVTFTIDPSTMKDADGNAVTVTSVSANGTTLPPANGTYTYTPSADTVITVVLSGDMYNPDALPSTGDAYSISIVVKDGTTGNAIDNATLTVQDDYQNVYTANADSKLYALPEGLYQVVAELQDYATVNGWLTVDSIGMTLGDNNINTVSVVMFPTTASKYDTTLHVISGTEYVSDMQIFSGDLRIDSKKLTAVGYSESEATFSLYAGDHSEYKYAGINPDGIGHGSGPFTANETQPLVLRAMDMTTHGLTNVNNAFYTVTMKSGDETEYWPGSLDSSNNGGLARGWFLLPASTYGEKYQFSFNPDNNAIYWGSSGTIYMYSGYVNTAIRNFTGLAGSQSDDGTFLIRPKTTSTITVPSGASLQVCRRVKFYEPLEILEPLSQSGNTYTYEVPQGATLHYEMQLAGYVEKASTFTGGDTLTITTADMTPASEAANDIPANVDSSVLTNAPDSHYIELDMDEKFELYLHRNWQATNSETGNYYVDPEFHVEVIHGSSVEIVDEYYAGATIKPRSTGVSIVRITYDPLEFVDTAMRPFLYSKSYEENTAILVVSVGTNAAATIDSGCGMTEQEIQYFVSSVTANDGEKIEGKNQYAEFTFTPGSNVTKVELHAPVGSKDAWTDTWVPVTNNGDGSYTANLTEGSNVLRFTAGGDISYHVVRAMGLDVKVNGEKLEVSHDETTGTFELKSETNVELTVSFDGLKMPVGKLAALINPGTGNVEGSTTELEQTTYSAYTVTGKDTGSTDTIISEKTQYAISTVNALTLNFVTADTYTLSEGVLHTTGFGAGNYKQMTKGGYTGFQPSYYAGINTEIDDRSAYFCSMPDLTFVIAKGADSEEIGVEKIEIFDAEKTFLASATVSEDDDSVWEASLPFDSTLPTDGNQIIVTPKHALATASTPTQLAPNDGSKWEFTVTAESGATKAYTLNVSISNVVVETKFLVNGGTHADLSKEATIIGYEQADVDKAIALPVPTKDGFIFQGWYDTGYKDSGTKTKYEKVTKDLPPRLYAHWTSESPQAGKIQVTFRLIGSTKPTQHINFDTNFGEYYGATYVTWIPTETSLMDEGSIVGNQFTQALEKAKLTYQGGSNYVSSITAPAICGGYVLSEFTNGPDSGWMFTVNGEHGNLGLDEQPLYDGDVVVWHYLNDSYEEGDNAAKQDEYHDKWLEAADVPPGTSDEEHEDVVEFLQNLNPDDIQADSAMVFLGLASEEAVIPEALINAYKEEIAEEIGDDVLANDPSEVATIALALVAMGEEPEVNSQNLVEALVGNPDWVTGSNNAAEATANALLAIVAYNGENDASVQTFIAFMLERQAEDGTWGDLDTTLTVLQSLAPYYDESNQDEVYTAVQNALTWLKKYQTTDGGFHENGGSTANVISSAKALAALVTLGIDPRSPAWLSSDGYSVYDALNSFKVEVTQTIQNADGTTTELTTTAYAPTKNGQPDANVTGEVLWTLNVESKGAGPGPSVPLPDVYESTRDHLITLTPTSGPDVTELSEWLMLGLARAQAIDDNTALANYLENNRDPYLAKVKTHIAGSIDANGRLHKHKSTENARVALALTALGIDPSDFEGYNLLKAFDDVDWTTYQGKNGAAWALIAMDACDYQSENNPDIREELLQFLLDSQSNGSWDGEKGIDITSMVLIALAPYLEDDSNIDAALKKEIEDAVDQALAWLKTQQTPNGGFADEQGDVSSESISQLIVALTALDEDPTTWGLIEALERFYVEENGQKGFKHLANGAYNQMATEQGFYALVAYLRWANGETSLFDMSDITSYDPGELEYTISIDTPEGGTITVEVPEGSASATTTQMNGTWTAKEGDTIKVTVTPDEGYQMVEGSLKYSRDIAGSEPVSIDESTLTFTMPASNITISCQWEKEDGEDPEDPEDPDDSVKPAITEFWIGQFEGIIDQESNSIVVTLPLDAKLRGIVPKITTENTESMSPGKGEAVNFDGSAVKYNLVGTDGVTTRTYTVTILLDNEMYFEKLWDQVDDLRDESGWWDQAEANKANPDGDYKDYWGVR